MALNLAVMGRNNLREKVKGVKGTKSLEEKRLGLKGGKAEKWGRRVRSREERGWVSSSSEHQKKGRVGRDF